MTVQSRILLWLAGILGIAVLVFVWIGFWFPDPFFMSRLAPRSGVLLWTLRIGIPAATLLMVWTVRRMRSGRISASGPLLLLAVTVVLGLVLYPLADWRYHESMQARRRTLGMHAFLQLAPLPLSGDFKPSEGSFRIFCLGGSTTELPDSTGRDWPSRVEERLRNQTGRPDVSVINCGRQWYTTLHMLVRYQTALKPLKPDVIVVMETINDLLLNADFSYFSGGPFSPDYGHFYGPISGPTFHKSLLFSGLGMIRRLWYFPERSVVETDSFPGLESYRRNLESLIDLARLDGARVVFMTQPNLFHENMTSEEKKALIMVNVEAVGPDRQWSVATAKSGFAQYKQALMETAASRGVPVLDLEAAVPKTLEYFKDDVHYRYPAYDLVADAVAGFLMKQDLKGL
jgi:lysophospholipase L1-like esterase